METVLEVETETKLETDPFSKFLEIFFDNALSPELSLWDEVKSAISLNPDPNRSFTHLHSFLVTMLLEDYNCRLLLKTGLIDLHKCPSQFPPLFIDHYSSNECLTWCWNRWVVPKWPELAEVPIPVITVNRDLAEEIAPKLTTFLNIEKVVSKPKWRVAAFQLSPKEILEKSVKYLIFEDEDKIRRSCAQNSSWKIEVAMKPLTPKTSLDEEKETSPDSQILLAQCVLRLCKILNYSNDENTKSESNVSTLGQFIQIPDSVNIASENILISFSSQSPELQCENSQCQVLMELNSKDYYSQYSETVVILYNYARIKTILERYDGLVASKEYPDLPPIDKVDFNLIGEGKDEFPIIMMLFMWPRVRRFVINIHRRGKGFDKINLPFLFDFVKSLARAFDSFYNRNVVIVPVSAPHNFRSMFANLYLLKAIAVIFKEFIYISGIEMD